MTDTTITPVAPVAESSAVPPSVIESPGAPGVSNQDTEPTPAPLAGKEHEQYLAGRQIAEDVACLYTGFSRSMAEISAPTEHVSAAFDWLESLPAEGANLPAQKVAHSYSVSVKLPAADQPGLISFLNHMAEVGASQSFVDQALKFYAGLNAPPASSPTDTMSDAAVEAMDAADRNRTRDVLRAEWGPTEYAVNIAAINELLDAMPEERRTYLEGEDDNGKLILNNPKILRALAHEARSKTPPALAAAMRETGLSERATIETLMRDRGSVYWKGRESADLQARYRHLLGGAKENLVARSASTDAEEIANIERQMRENPRAYFRDETKQARYRKLITMRDGQGT